MFTQIASVILSLALIFVLPATAPSPWLYMAAVIFLCIVSVVVNIKKVNFSWSHLMLPVIYIMSVSSVFLIITNPALRLPFLILAAINLFFIEFNLGKESHLLQNAFLLSVFGLYAGMFAFHYYFNLNHWWLLLGMFVITYVLILQGFAGFSLPAKKYFVWLISLVVTQITWALSFWPTFYLVNATAVFLVFYIFWIFSFSAFFGKLSRHKLFLQLGLIIIVLGIVLGTTPWRPLTQ